VAFTPGKEGKKEGTPRREEFEWPSTLKKDARQSMGVGQRNATQKDELLFQKREEQAGKNKSGRLRNTGSDLDLERRRLAKHKTSNKRKNGSSKGVTGGEKKEKDHG